MRVDSQVDCLPEVAIAKKSSEANRIVPKSDSSFQKEINDESDNSTEFVSESSDVRRSARKRKTRFSLKELVSSDEDEEDENESGRKTMTAKRNKRPSKKEMRQKVKEFIGSSDEDEYKPNNSEQSDDDEIPDADEEQSNDDTAESDVSDVIPTTSKKSKYFNKNINKSSSTKNYSRKTSSNFKPIKSDSNLDVAKYKAHKSGGCLFNSIGIDSLGNPQADLLKHKIANFKLPGDLTQTVSQACKANQQPEGESAFGNGSCVRKLLMDSHITKHYETYKNKLIEKTKNKEKVDPKELMDMLTVFETGVATTDQKPSTSANDSDSDGDTDDEDFEEVENADVGEHFDDSYRPACMKAGVTIEVKPSFKPKDRNKNDDWIYDAIRQGINRQRSEIFVDATKVDFVCNLARVKYLNELTFDLEMQALAISIDFFNGLETKSITKSFVKKFIDKYKSAFKFNYSKDRSQLLTSREVIRKFFEAKETCHPTVYNLTLLILFRTFCSHYAIEEKSRLCIAFRPIDSKCDNLLSKGEKVPAKESKKCDDFDNEEEEDEKPVKKAKGKTVVAKKVVKGKGKSTRKKKEESEDDEHFEQSVKKSTKKPTKKTEVNEDRVTADKALNTKNLVEIWIEIHLEDQKELVIKKNSKKSEKNVVSTSGWYCIELVNEVFTTTPTEVLEKKFYVNPLYVLSFNSNHYLKDLTPKYIANFYLHKFKRLPLEDDWLNEVYAAYRPSEPTLEEQDENEQIRRYYLDKPLPKNLSDYKNHGLYFLERHLLKFEIIWPNDATVVGKFNDKENVYLRENVHQTHGREYWKKEARQVKEGEEALKITPARPKWDKNAGDWIRDIQLELYHISQTEEWDPGEVVDGKVPRGAYGNVDLFKPCMLPRGASYLRLNGLAKIAARLDIDCPSAVTGFELRKNMTVPLVDGFVVPSECEEILTIASISITNECSAIGGD